MCECRYGSYEICNDPGFTRDKVSLIDRGFIYAMAHVRGGGEMGRQWYEQVPSLVTFPYCTYLPPLTMDPWQLMLQAYRNGPIAPDPLKPKCSTLAAVLCISTDWSDRGRPAAGLGLRATPEPKTLHHDPSTLKLELGIPLLHFPPP